MGVLFFASDYQIGLSSLLTDQLIALKRNNIDVYPIAGEKSQEDELNGKIEYHDIALHRIDGLDTHKHFFKLCYLLKEIIKSHDIRLIHVQNNWQLAISSYIKTFLLPHKKIKIAHAIYVFDIQNFNRNPRKPEELDTVGRDLRQLLKSHTHTPFLQEYISFWFTIQASVYMRFSCRSNIYSEIFKAIKLKPKSLKLWGFILIGILPLKIRIKLLK